jgi:hypothetical protein
VEVSEVEVLQLAALGLLFVAGRLVFAYFRPYRPCRWCRPGGLVDGSLPARLLDRKPRPRRKRKRRRCWRCEGTKLTRRWGAWHSHKIKDSIAQAWAERGTE